MEKFTKIVIDHNNDTIYIVPGGNEEFTLHSQMCKFIKVKDTSMIEKLLNEIFNRIGEGRNGYLNIELETFNEEDRKLESW